MNWVNHISRSKPSTSLGAITLSVGGRFAVHVLPWVALVALGCAAGLRAAEDDLEPLPDIKRPPKTKQELIRLYASVVEWRGIWSASESEDFDTGDSVANSLHKGYRSHGEFVLTPVPDSWMPQDGNFTWGGPGIVRAENSLVSSYWRKYNPTGYAENYTAGGTLPTEGARFGISLDNDYLSITAGWATERLPGTMEGFAVNQLGESDNYGYERKTYVPSSNVAETPLYPLKEMGLQNTTPRPGGRGPGVFQFQDSDVRNGFNYSSRLTLYPVYDDLEVEVTIEGYEKWRPLGSIDDPKKPGNGLVAHAVLKSKNTKSKVLPEVDHFTVELRETSREPGVCLNWPLGAKDDNFDLQLVDFSTISGPDQAKAVLKWVEEWNMASSGDFDAEGKPGRAMPQLTIGSVTADGQKMEIVGPPTDKAGRAFVDVAVESFDFGGRAELRVICVLKDGREIIGLIKTEGGKDDLVWLPKMKSPGWVAESWRKEHEVEKLPDNDDEEKVAGQPMNGDGYTLYEEYRGWVVNGKHRAGDPKKKELFVRNEVGADAKGGIALFERVSKIKVHADLRASEIIILPTFMTGAEADAKGQRIMNWNHRDAPHRTDQHGVQMITVSGFASSGGRTKGVFTAVQEDVAFRPKSTREVALEAKNVSNGLFSNEMSVKNFALSERDASFAYDRGVAHELLHAVGVDHHGELGEERRGFYFQASTDPTNPTHRARFVNRMPPTNYDLGNTVLGRPAVWSDFDRGPTFTLLWEDTHEDVALLLEADFQRELAAEREKPIYDHNGADRAARFPQYGKSASFWSELEIHNGVSDGMTRRAFIEGKARPFDREITIGDLNRNDSGNELCLMRYYFATAYPVPGSKNTYYLIRPGGNRAGRELCTSPAGTGGNAPGHQPQSRFGDAAPGRGGCFAQICPNDAIPPRKL